MGLKLGLTASYVTALHAVLHGAFEVHAAPPISQNPATGTPQRFWHTLTHAVLPSAVQVP
jgi:hypothetical protein